MTRDRWVRSFARLIGMGLVGLASCAAPPPGVSLEGLDDDGGVSGADGATCASGREGCPCAAEPPRDCYLDPTTLPGGGMTCHAGTRYCRAGTWTACESISDYTIESTASSLIGTPGICNPCDPRCFLTTDTPTTGDLTTTTSTGASYDPSRGVVIPSSTGPMMGGPATSADDDHDGVPNAADGCDGNMGCDGTAAGCCSCTTGVGVGAPCDAHTWLFHALNLGGPAISDRLPITYAVRSADVYFLMDTTGSMGGELTRLRTDLTTGTFIAGCPGGIIGAIQCTIPNAQFGVGYYDDYPYCPDGRCYGWNGAADSPTLASPDYVFRHLQDISGTISASQTAINTLAIHNGADGPEGQIPAIYSVASGLGLGSYSATRTGCAAGLWGYPCFRTNAIPIIIQITDAPFHNGPGTPTPYPYCIGGTMGIPPPSTSTAVSGDHTLCTSGTTPAIPVGSLNGRWLRYTGTTNAATVPNHLDWTCGGVPSTSARDMVFEFSLTSAQLTTFSLEGSGYDTMISIWSRSGSATCPNFTTPAYCNDDYFGLQSYVQVNLPAGNYYVVVDGYSSNVGNFVLTMGQEPTAACSGATHTPPTFAETAAALNARGAHIITMQTCGTWTDPYCQEGEAHAIALGRATSSTTVTAPTCATATSGNCRSSDAYVLRGAADGSGLSTAVVNAVVDLAHYSRMNITARPNGDTYNFVRNISSFRWGPAGSCNTPTGGAGQCWDLSTPASTSDCFIQCTPGTDVKFDVTLQNTSAPAGVYAFFIDVIGNPGNVILQRVPVRIIVHGMVTTYAPTASYWHDYDSTLRCLINERPAWGSLAWTADIPAGTSIRFDLRTSDDPLALATATPVASATITTTGAGTRDIATMLMAAGALDSLRYLRVTAVLMANAALTASPALSSMSVNYECVPSE
jgi:hypothetical protein